MADIKISDLAKLLNMDSNQMLSLLEKSGIKSRKADDYLNDQEKNLLLKAIKDKSRQLKPTINLKSSSSISIDKTVRKMPNLSLKNQQLKTKQTERNTSSLKIKEKITDLKDQLAQDKFSLTMKAKEQAIAQKQIDNQVKKESGKKAQPDQQKDNTEIKLKKNEFNPEYSDKNSFNEEKLAQKKSNHQSDNSLRASLAHKKKTQEEQRQKFRQQTRERLLQSVNRIKQTKTSENSDIENIHKFEKPVSPVTYEVKLPENISVSELAQQISVKQSVVIEILMNLDIAITANQSIDRDIAIIVIEELGHTYTLIEEQEEQDVLLEEENYELKDRNPVVTIMGHVDHGKTTLLDTIRKTKITQSEAGGITQHIGAYQVKLKNKAITFIDTPGHQAFSAMRARGADITDIIILVVAADDSVMPQTIESIQHAKAAKVPIIVAVNKMDKPGANADKVTKDLAQYALMPESWGGDNLFVNVSALKNQGIDDLLEAIILQAEMLDLKAPMEGKAKGIVVESRMEKGKGAIITALVTSGVLKNSDIVLCGLHYGKIRLLTDDTGKAIKTALPVSPVEILGISGVCEAGDDLIVLDKEKDAKNLALKRQQRQRENRLEKQQSASLDSFLDRMSSDQIEKNEHYILFKADVQGSLEAISSELKKLSTDEVKVNIVGTGVGAISETDVNLAISSKAMIIGFNVRCDSKARELVKKENINLKYYSIIYELLDDMQSVIKGLHKDEYIDEIIGVAEVREVFRSPKYGDIAGCMITEGVVKRSNQIRVLRDKVVIFEGKLESLRRIKEDVAEVKKGTECGIGVKDYDGIKKGDQIEVYQKVKVERK